MNLVGKKVFPACFSYLAKPGYQVRMRSTMEVLERCDVCKLERDHSSNTFLLTLRNDGRYENERHLNPVTISIIREYLGHAKSLVTKGSLLITTGEGDSFCEGFDYRYAGEGSDEPTHKNRYLEMIDLFRGVVSDLISFPTPTVAAINGYAFGAGLMLAISHDHLAMKNGINSLKLEHLGKQMSLPPYFAALIRSKVWSPLARRSLVLGDVQYDAENAKVIGVLNMRVKVGKDAVKVAKRFAKYQQDSNGKSYVEFRQNLYPELFLEFLDRLTTAQITNSGGSRSQIP